MGVCVCALTADYIEIQAAFAFAQLLKMVWHTHTPQHIITRALKCPDNQI